MYTHTMTNERKRLQPPLEYDLPLTEEKARALQPNDTVIMSATKLMNLITARETQEYSGITRIEEEATLTVTINRPNTRTVTLEYRQYMHDLREQLGAEFPEKNMGTIVVSYDQLLGFSIGNLIESTVKKLKGLLPQTRS